MKSAHHSLPRRIAFVTLASGLSAGTALWGAQEASSEVRSSPLANEVTQLAELVERQQQQIEEQRRLLEAQGLLLMRLSEDVEELRQGAPTLTRASWSGSGPAAALAAAPVPDPVSPAEAAASLAITASSDLPSAPPLQAKAPAEAKAVKETQAAAQSAPAPDPNEFKVYWNNGLRFDTPDKSVRFRIGGRVMNDWAFFMPDDATKNEIGGISDGTEFRRTRLYFQGQLHDRVHFKAQWDFAGGDAALKDMYLGFNKVPIFGDVIVGHRKEPFSLEEQTSSKYITFMERSLGNVFAPSRNTGLLMHKEGFDKRLAWDLGVYRDTGDFGAAVGDGKYAVTTRLSGRPWLEEDGRKVLHLGLAYSHRKPTLSTLRFRQRPEAHIAPRFVNTGFFPAKTLDLIGVEAAVVLGSASFQSEYTHALADPIPAGSRLNFSSFYAQGSYFLTGEHRPYNTASGAFDRIKPLEAFGMKNDRGIGAWEIAARYSRLNLNDQFIVGGKLQDLTLGLNWYLNPNMRLMWNYVLADRTDIGKTNILQTRFQVDF